MPRLRGSEVRTRFLDTLLLVFSVAATIISAYCIFRLLTTVPEFYVVPFTEFLILLTLGLFGIRTWRKETAP